MLNFSNTWVGIIKKYYWLVILLALLVSYGQTLFMLPWQDDNALFFKLANIDGPAGFIGKGITGEGAYKYTAFFYYPIYLIFGYKEFYYFAFGLIMYGLSVAAVYKVSSKLLNDNTAKLVAFLYSCGFIGSDSYIRLFNSVITSISVIGVCFFIYFYWKYYKEKHFLWYLTALGIFLVASELARARTHYLIALPIVFELLFNSFRKPYFKSLVLSFLRVAPFLPIFYKYVIMQDARSKGILDFINSLISGDFYKTYGFLSSLTNLFLPDWFVSIISPRSSTEVVNSYISNSTFYILILGLFSVFLTIFLIVKYKKKRIYTISFLVASIVWKFISSPIFVNANLSISPDQAFLAYVGGEILLLFLLSLTLISGKKRLIYVFVFLGLLINLLSYSAYNPAQVYEKINRYLSHSFFYLVIAFGVLYYAIPAKFKRVVLIAIVAWGLNNLVEGYFYQKQILIYRTAPVRAFYDQFKKYVSNINKGDIIYFDVEDSVRGSFSNAFSVAQMPDATAIAWRYGVDRYDFEMFQDSSALFNYLSLNKYEYGQLKTFFYSPQGLLDTTSDFRSLLTSKTFTDLDIEPKSSEFSMSTSGGETWIGKSEIEFADGLNVKSLKPLKLVVEMAAQPLSLNDYKFPVHYSMNDSVGNFIKDQRLRNMAFEYQKHKLGFKKIRVTADSVWQDRGAENLIDGNYDSVWQSDRVLWSSGSQSVKITTGDDYEYNRVVFVNGFSDHTPTEFDILSSDDGNVWSKLGQYRSSKRLKSGQMVEVPFMSSNARYFKVEFKKTLNNDSPAISELWLVPTKFSDLGINETETFLKNVFSEIPSLTDYNQLLRNSDYRAKVEVLWSNNQKFGWQRSSDVLFNIVLDGLRHSYVVSIPPGGTQINKLKFNVLDAPAEITINKIGVQY